MTLEQAMETLRDSFESAEWFPSEHTPSLTGTEDFITDGDALVEFINNYWREEDVEGQFILDEWQTWLIRHVLERYPADWPVERLRGRLRYRQVLISMGRQNGKSILGAIFGVYGLMFHEYAPKVVGLAYSKETAKVVYNRVAYTLTNVKVLSKRTKVTKTSGIRRTDKPGDYSIKPATEKAIQGFPMTMCIYDEVHITKPELWAAAKQGTKTKADGIVIGITTAGDDESELLKDLYKAGREAINNPENEDRQRFGFFLWEAPEGATLDDESAIKRANPAVASGRVDINNVRTDAQDDPPHKWMRYVLNRFVESSNAWIDRFLWNAREGEGLPAEARNKAGITYGVDVSEGMGFASITANKLMPDGKVYSRMVASVPNPTKESLTALCVELAKKGSPRFAMDGLRLKWLSDELKQKGYRTYLLSKPEMSEAAINVYRMVSRELIEVRNEPVLKMQVPRGSRRNFGDTWMISRADSSIEIDALMATVVGAHVAERFKEDSPQFYLIA